MQAAEQWIPMNRGIDFRCSQPAYYRIDVFGTLDARWLRDYVDMRVEYVTDVGDCAMTRLTGELPDQSALMGVLHLLNDLGAPLSALECFPNSIVKTTK